MQEAFDTGGQTFWIWENTRHVFFHNGAYQNLRHVMDFYDFRDTEPGKIYPTDAAGQVRKYNDLPASDWATIDTADPPFMLQPGQTSALTRSQEHDIIDELLELAHRVLVMSAVDILHEADRANADRRVIGIWMAGQA